MPVGRKHLPARLCAGLTAFVAVIMTSIVVATPAVADPDQHDLKRAQANAKQLLHEAEVASERYNHARVELRETRKRLRSLNASLDDQQRKVDRMRGEVAGMVVEDYQSGALSTASQLVLSDDPDVFIDNMTAMSAYHTQQGEILSTFAAQLDRLEQRREAVDKKTAAAARVEKRLAREKASLDARAARAQNVLDNMKADVRAAMMNGTWDGPIPAAAGRAAVALRYAMAQVGKSYVYGATGPSAFDCSGLTMRAWGAAGVSLPHSSSAQYSSGPHIPESQLQPGDLVFYYSPISHVGIYIGNGQIVHAANPGTGVTTSPLHSMPYVGAVRPG